MYPKHQIIVDIALGPFIQRLVFAAYLSVLVKVPDDVPGVVGRGNHHRAIRASSRRGFQGGKQVQSLVLCLQIQDGTLKLRPKTSSHAYSFN